MRDLPDDPQLHPTAVSGFSSQAEAYAKARPEYPSEAAAWLRDSLGIRPTSRVLEVGAGTGKFTKLLVATGAEVIAVEPVTAMRDRLQELFPNLRSVEGMAERLPFPDGAFDAVVCAQSFHWFATAQVLDEFARVLRAGGQLGLIWNVRDESEGWVARLGDLWREKEGELPRYSPELLATVFPHPEFGPLARQDARHSQSGPVETVVLERMRSISFVAAMPPQEQEAFLARAQEIIDQEPSLAGATSVTFPYITNMFCAQRL